MLTRKALRRLRDIALLALMLVVLGAVFLLYPRARVNDLFRYLSLGSPFVLGLMGVFVALHEEWAKKHRVFVIVAFTVASALAFYVTNRQASESAKETAEAQRQATDANAKLSDSVEDLHKGATEISRVQALNTRLQEKLLASSEQLLASSGKISDLSGQAVANSKESLRNIMGADSIPCIVPQVYVQVDPVLLMIFNRGEHLLTGVTVRIRHEPAEFFTKPELSVGVVHPGIGKMLSEGVSPKPDSTGIDTYLIDISTQSEQFSQTLVFRKGKDASPWAYRYWVWKHTLKRAKGSKAENFEVIRPTKWSDESG